MYQMSRSYLMYQMNRSYLMYQMNLNYLKYLKFVLLLYRLLDQMRLTLIQFLQLALQEQYQV
jgi:hypothetical protein